MTANNNENRRNSGEEREKEREKEREEERRREKRKEKEREKKDVPKMLLTEMLGTIDIGRNAQNLKKLVHIITIRAPVRANKL